MTTSTDVAVTYTGREDPFKDRIYRSGLTFTPGQTRVLPAPLAARFLRHSDVFKPAAAPEPVAPSAPTEPTAPTTPTEPTDPTQTTTETQQPDNTQALLDAAKKQEDDQRQQDSARFELLDSIESMDRTALITWADLNYKQKIPANVSVAKARDMARGFIDQYGMPA